MVRKREGPFKVAASIPLRIFEPSLVRRAPTETEIAAIESEFPGAMIWNECERDQELCDFERIEDGKSYRYAVVNLGGKDREELEDSYQRLLARLDFQFVGMRK